MEPGDIVKSSKVGEHSYVHVFEQGEPITFSHPKTGKRLVGTIVSVDEDYREKGGEPGDEICDWVTIVTKDGKEFRVNDDDVIETEYVRIV